MSYIDAEMLKRNGFVLAKVKTDKSGEVTEFMTVEIDDAPTADVVEVRHREWVRVESSDMSTGIAYICSECKKMRYGSYLPPYCQMCGAKMDGKKEKK